LLAIPAEVLKGAVTFPPRSSAAYLAISRTVGAIRYAMHAKPLIILVDWIASGVGERLETFDATSGRGKFAFGDLERLLAKQTATEAIHP